MTLMLSAEPSPVEKAETQADFSANALRALHRILIRLRSLAYNGTDPRTMGRILDDVEYLGVLVLQSQNDSSPEKVADFRLHLQDLETKFSGFERLTAAFDEWQKPPVNLKNTQH